MKKGRVHPLVLLLPGIAAVATSLITALDLVPRVRLVDVMIVFATAVGGGAALAASVFEYHSARAARGHAGPSAAGR
jgi:hypothetical protein